MHLLAQRGWWDNLLANDLNGGEDHLGRGVVRQFWDELSVNRLREQALLDVEGEWNAGRLPWGTRQENHRAIPSSGAA